MACAPRGRMALRCAMPLTRRAKHWHDGIIEGGRARLVDCAGPMLPPTLNVRNPHALARRRMAAGRAIRREGMRSSILAQTVQVAIRRLAEDRRGDAVRDHLG